MVNETTIHRLPAYPSTSARKSLSPTQLLNLNQTISSSLLQTIALPPSKRDSPAARTFVATYAKDSALQTLHGLIWNPGPISKEDKIIRKRALLLAEKIVPALDIQTLLDLAIVYAPTNGSKIKSIFEQAIASNSQLVHATEADLIPAFTHLFNPSQGLYGIRKAAYCVVSFLRASAPELVRSFSHNQPFILGLATLYDQGLSTIAHSYGGLSIFRNQNTSNSGPVDEWEPIWVQTKVDLIDAFHIIISSLLNAISVASGRGLAMEAERTFGIIFALLEIPSSSATASSTSLIPFFNRSLLSDYQDSYSLSNTLNNALRNAAEKDARLDLLESALQSLESPSSDSRERKDAGALKILLGSGVPPGIDNRGIGSSRPRSAVPLSSNSGTKNASIPLHPSTPDLDVKVTQVLDIFPDHRPEYVRALLEQPSYGGDPEKVVMALLEGSAPLPEELELGSQAGLVIRSNDNVAHFVNGRRNVFDDEVMDLSRLHIGKTKGDASTLLEDKSFVEQSKADILRLAQAIAEEELEEEDELHSSKTSGIDYAFDEDEDPTAVSAVKISGDGEESGHSDVSEEDDGTAKPSLSQDVETILELAYIKDPKVFDRDNQTKASKARKDLQAQTNWTHEQIEGWRIMLERNPRKDKILQKHEFAGNRIENPISVNNSRADSSDSTRGGGGNKGRGRGGGARGGRGGGSGGGSGGANSARERASKDKNKASRGNHNRKRGFDKKMARAGAGIPPP